MQTVLIDAFSQIFRAFFAIRILTNSRGEPTNALHVFTRLLMEIDRACPAERGALLFDCGKVPFRLELNPDYKANRPPMPDELRSQIPVIRDMAAAFGWPLLEEPDYEADDLAAVFAVHSPGEVVIVSSDKDLGQLVDDRVSMLSPNVKGGFERRGPAEVTAKFGVPPRLIPDYLALVGDSSDNIGGVPGVGPKTAAAILNAAGPVESWLGRIASLDPKFAKKLAGCESLLLRNLALVRLKAALPPRFADVEACLKRRQPDWDRVAAICERMELRSIMRDLPQSPDWPAEPVAPSSPGAPAAPEMEQGELF
ncbi:MAG: 5'-3' exonuclease H3TH domain-containing protein [Victivallaceae bacterium]|nr:5'-3' exonuclease H3TH domain-containing protein [Victivallaceae bacterium]